MAPFLAHFLIFFIFFRIGKTYKKGDKKEVTNGSKNGSKKGSKRGRKSISGGFKNPVLKLFVPFLKSQFVVRVIKTVFFAKVCLAGTTNDRYFSENDQKGVILALFWVGF